MQYLRTKRRSLFLGSVMVAMATLLIVALACGADEPAPAPAPAPTAVPAPTAMAAPTAMPAPVATPTQAVMEKGGPQRGGVLTFPLTFSIDAPDPAYSVQTGTRRILWLVFNSLVKQTPSETVSPDLAKSWEISADGKVITFNLQEGVKFHDGTDFNAQAVKWTYDRFTDAEVGSPRKNQLIPMERVEVVDDLTLKMYLEVAFRPFLANLTLRPGQMASPTAVEAANSYADRNGDFGRRPVGTGPFLLDEWLPDQRFVLSRNPNYWEEGLPYLDGVNVPIIGDKQIQFAMLRTGEIDIMEEMRPDDRPIIERNPDIKTVVHEGTSTWMVFLRIDQAPFDNQLVRNAISKAIDRETFAKLAFDGAAVPAYSVLGPSTGDWFDPDFRVNEYDPDAARQLLAQAGYANGLSFDFPTRSNFQQQLEILQSMFADVGINISINQYETTTYWSDFVSGQHDGPLVTFFSPRPDPHILLRRLYHTKGVYGNNVFKFDSPRADALMDEIATIYDVAEAKSRYRELLTLVAEEGPVIPLVWQNVFFAMRSDVNGFAPVSDRVPRLAFLWFDR